MSISAIHGPAGPAPHTPGAGLAKLRELWGDRIPDEIPADVQHEVDDLIAETKRRVEGHRAA